MGTQNNASIANYRPHQKDGKGNVFSLSTPEGGGVRSVNRGGFRSVQLLGGGGGSGQSSWGVRSVQPGGGVSSVQLEGVVRSVQLGGGWSGQSSQGWGQSSQGVNHPGGVSHQGGSVIPGGVSQDRSTE